MSSKANNIKYQILEWDVASFIEYGQTIVTNSSQHIHKIKLNKKEEVYLVPNEFYLAAKECLKRSREGK